MKALNEHPTLKGIFERNDAKFIYRAADAKAHKGYQTWHRAVDSEVVGWLEINPNASPKQFKNFLNEIYSRPGITELIPGVKID